VRSVGAVAIGGVETGDRCLGRLSHLAKGSPRRVADRRRPRPIKAALVVRARPHDRHLPGREPWAL